MTDLLAQPGTWVGAAIAGVGVLTGWLKDRKRGDVDQNTLLFEQWKRLNDEYKAQIEPLRNEVRLLSHRVGELENINRRLLAENEGLVRQLAQKSQSEVVMLGTSIGGNAPSAKRRFADPDQDLLDRLDR